MATALSLRPPWLGFPRLVGHTGGFLCGRLYCTPAVQTVTLKVQVVAMPAAVVMDAVEVATVAATGSAAVAGASGYL